MDKLNNPKTLRQAQVELDRSIDSLVNYLLKKELKWGRLRSLSVEVKSLKASKLNRLLAVGKVMTWLLPISVLIGIAGGRELDLSLVKDSSSTPYKDWSYSEVFGLVGVASSVGWAARQTGKTLSKSTTHQTFILAEFEKTAKRFFIYDLADNEKPDNMDLVILKRIVDEFARKRGIKHSKIKSNKVALLEDGPRRSKVALTVPPSNNSEPVRVPEDWLLNVCPPGYDKIDFDCFRNTKRWYRCLYTNDINQATDQIKQELEIPLITLEDTSIEKKINKSYLSNVLLANLLLTRTFIRRGSLRVFKKGTQCIINLEKKLNF